MSDSWFYASSRFELHISLQFIIFKYWIVYPLRRLLWIPSLLWCLPTLRCTHGTYSFTFVDSLSLLAFKRCSLHTSLYCFTSQFKLYTVYLVLLVHQHFVSYLTADVALRNGNLLSLTCSLCSAFLVTVQVSYDRAGNDMTI